MGAGARGSFPREIEKVSDTVLTKSLLASGKAKEALPDAKSLYNVCSMANTSNAILLLAECLGAANPEDKGIVDRLKVEQLAGAELPSTQPSTKPADAGDKQQKVMDSIQIDSAPYDAAIKQITGEDYASLLKRGNLLLLIDRAKEAKPLFERAYSLCADAQLTQASESIARQIKAENHAIGRANAWVLSIRPKN